MNNFIASVAAKIFASHKENLGSVLVVFPSRRAGVYFRKELSALLVKPVWSPSVMSINEFIASFSKLELADKLTLIMKLYKSYTKHFIDEPFDEFYSWGEMLLKDFDEVDKHLVNAEHLFRKLKDEKEIEHRFQTEINEDAKNFWGSLIKIKPGSEYTKNFLNIWNSLFEIYSGFRSSLVKDGLAYEGLAAREIAENINSTSSFDNYEMVYFAGFNSLNRCEFKIINSLKEKGKAVVLWDADKYYLDDAKQESGLFIRKFQKLLGGDIIESEDSLSSAAKHIEVIGSPLNAGMVKAFGSKLEQEIISGNILPKNTLVVIPDPSGLLPVLYSMPANSGNINVTMGLPLKSTPLYNLISIINKLHSEKIFEDGKPKFYFKDVINLLMHPYIKFASAKDIFAFVRKVRQENIVYIDVFTQFLNSLGNTSIKIILTKIFTSGSDVNDTINNLNNIVNSLAIRMEESTDADNDYKLFQLEYLYSFSTQLNRLADALTAGEVQLNHFTFWNMLMQMLNTTGVVFTGEPLKGLQVMGLLEARNLSFKNIFILYMNEDSMPPGNQGLSYIPYSLRKSFGMPTYEESDSVNAYYFWSLVQKAKHVCIFYNTETGNEVKEMSRYIQQIEKELLNVNKNIEYSHTIISPKESDTPDSKIEIPKTPELNEFMLNRIKRMSPTYLADYINCGLQFYLKKVLGLKEDEDVEEVFSPASFGTVFHGIMQILYKPYLDKVITGDIIDNIINDVINNYDDIFESFLKSDKKLSNVNFSAKGRNLLYKSIIRRLVIKLLEQERNRNPYTVKALEAELYTSLKFNVNGKEREIRIGGVVDRIDEESGVTTVIDYKTGNADIMTLSPKYYEKFWEEFPSNTKYKSNLQTMLYAYVLWLENPEKQYNAGLYPVKNLKEGIKTISITPFTDSDMKQFESVLLFLLEDIFNTDKPFTQTENLENCSYCDFKTLCRR
ncbi:MAG: PD-(D/E)XK nuclease family protein [Candidatus Kapaibacterium sp.]